MIFRSTVYISIRWTGVLFVVGSLVGRIHEHMAKYMHASEHPTHRMPAMLRCTNTIAMEYGVGVRASPTPFGLLDVCVRARK